jgi:dTMP kinase
MSERGKLIVIEGVGGCGKDTQVDLTAKYLEFLGVNLLVTREHTRDTPPGALIERIIKNKEKQIDHLALQLLYVSDRRNHWKEVIEPNLAGGKMVLANRYYPSTVAYSPEEWRKVILDLNQTVVGRPDLVMVIDTEPEISARRAVNRGDPDIFDEPESLKRCRAGYRWYAENSGDPVKWIDGNGQIEEVSARLIREIRTRGMA